MKAKKVFFYTVNHQNQTQKAYSLIAQKKLTAIELAVSFIHQKQYAEAEELLDKVLQSVPGFSKALIQKSRILKIKGEFEQAEVVLKQVLAQNPHSVAALNNLGNIYAEQNRFNDALHLYEKVLLLNPRQGHTHKNIGLIHVKTNNYREAMQHFAESHKLMPLDCSVLFEIGKLYDKNGNLLKAIEIYNEILKIDAGNLEVMMLLGINYRKMGHFEKATPYFEQVWRQNPRCSEAFYLLARCKSDIADWNRWDDTRRELIETLERDLAGSESLNCSPMDVHYYDIPDELQFRVMKRIAAKHSGFRSGLFSFTGRKHKKLRIGYLSPDFRAHALGMSVYKMFSHHNREAFEVYVFSQFIPNENDPFHLEIKASADRFFDIQNLDEAAVARLIYENEIDILVDFGGYSTHTKPGILRLKPAPVQVFMFGQPDTTAMPEVDYFISDKLLIDSENRQYYTENILYLPYGFICSPIKANGKAITRAEVGIAPDAFVFCSFCNPYKFEPFMFAVWMKLLQQVDNSVLYLMSNGNATFEKNILSEATLHDVDPARLFFANNVSVADHIERMKTCDLFLDTPYYSSCSSASHALMAGLPVVTLCGKTNASRQGASVCHAAGLDEMICYSTNEYFQKALQLASKPLELDKLKKYLSQKQREIPHFDLALNVGYIEEAYRKIWDVYSRGKTQNDIVIN